MFSFLSCSMSAASGFDSHTLTGHARIHEFRVYRVYGLVASWGHVPFYGLMELRFGPWEFEITNGICFASRLARTFRAEGCLTIGTLRGVGGREGGRGLYLLKFGPLRASLSPCCGLRPLTPLPLGEGLRCSTEIFQH